MTIEVKKFWNEIKELEKIAKTRTQTEIQHKIEKRIKEKKKRTEVFW